MYTLSISTTIVLLLFLCLVSHAYVVPRAVVRAGRFDTSKFLFGNSEPKNVPEKKNGGGGMFGGMGNMMEAMKKAQDMAKQAELMNKELESTFITGYDTSGDVVATFNGIGKPIGVKVADSILALGGDAVSLAVTQAVLDAHAKSNNAMMGRVKDMYGSLGLPTPPMQ